MNYPTSVWTVTDRFLTDKGVVCTEETDDGDWSTKSPIYVNPATGEEAATEQLPVGAILDWTEVGGVKMKRTGPDGRYLVCKMPEDGHFWHIDGRANNCTLPDDDEHRCWVRSGPPECLTVGKEGFTCQAGAGSIQTPTWHGFLRNGVLEEC